MVAAMALGGPAQGGPAQGELAGFTAAVTADRRRDEQAVILGRLGLDVVMYPLLQTNSTDKDALRALTEQLIVGPPDMVLANTGYGMRTWLGLAGEWGLLDGLVASLMHGPVIGARGAKAVGELRKAGLDAVYRAPRETLGELVAWAAAQGVAGKRVVLQLHGEGSEPVVATLEAAGAAVTQVPIYRMGTGQDIAANGLIEALLRGGIDVVTFTAAPQLEALAEAAAGRAALDAVVDCFNSRGVIAACIGPVCAAWATDIGIEGPLVPEHTRLGAMGTAIAGALAARQLTVDGEHGPVHLSGRYVKTAEASRELGEPECRVLRPLAAAPGQWLELPNYDGQGEVLPALATALDGALEVTGGKARLLTPAGA